MSPEATESHNPPGRADESAGRQRFGLVMAVGLGVIAGGFSYFGTRDAWVTTDRRPGTPLVATFGAAADPAWDLELPDGPHRDAFQTSCLVCHSARLPFSQPAFHREKWVEIVHKMVDAYGAPMTPEDESQVVDYLLAVRPPGS
jgi:hypothetical protein